MPRICRTNPYPLSDTIIRSASAAIGEGSIRLPSGFPETMTRGTSMQNRPTRRTFLNYATSAILPILVSLAACLAASPARAQERRDREPNSVYADRRAKLAAQVESPIVLWGLTGREESSQTYIFEQEESFYYLTGHNEEGAALIILPAAKSSTNDPASGPREFFYLPAKNALKEKWNGVRMSPTEPGIEARTGFATVKPFAELRATVEEMA